MSARSRKSAHRPSRSQAREKERASSILDTATQLDIRVGTDGYDLIIGPPRGMPMDVYHFFRDAIIANRPAVIANILLENSRRNRAREVLTDAIGCGVRFAVLEGELWTKYPNDGGLACGAMQPLLNEFHDEIAALILAEESA